MAREQLGLWQGDTMAIMHAAREASEIAHARFVRLEEAARRVVESRRGDRVDPRALDALTGALNLEEAHRRG